jgi:hypothetical protein
MDFHMLMKKAFLKKYFIFDYMKTIPQKCFRPYQKKTDDTLQYIRQHRYQKGKEFSQEMAGALEFIKTDFF